MSVDLDDQLKAYGSWLRETYGADLCPPVSRAERTGRNIRVDPEADRHPSLGRSWLRVAAALLVVVGIGGLVLAQRDTNSPPATAQYKSPIDPAAHLFVLPADPQSLELGSGGAYTARPEQAEPPLEESTGTLIGIERDGGFSNLVYISVTNAIPEASGLDESTKVDTPTGPAIVAGDRLPFQRLAQQRGDVWLLLTGTNGNQDLIEVLSNVSIDSSGSLTVQGGQRVIIDEFSQSLAAVDYSTYYEATDPASGTTFVVETATSPSAIALGAFSSDTVTPTMVNGTPAWIMTRDGDPPEGLNTAIVWRATPNRVIAVSAPAQSDVVKAMAERLQQVTDEEWFTALPGAFTED